MRSKLPKNASLVPDHATRVFKGVIFDVYHWQETLFNGSTATFEKLKRPDTLKIIAIKNGEIVVLKEEQPHLGLFYDIPGGRHDRPDETELQAAQRELREETGLTFASWKLLSVTQPLGKIEWFIYTFLATDFVSQQPPQLDAGEKITVTTLPFNKAKQVLSSEKSRWLPEQIKHANNLNDLLSLPEYK